MTFSGFLRFLKAKKVIRTKGKYIKAGTSIDATSITVETNLENLFERGIW